MKSLSPVTTKMAVYCIALILLLIRCSKDKEEVKPVDDDNEPPPITSITKTIGSDGGTIALDSIIITIPEGAFDTDYDLSLAVEKTPVEHPNPAVTGIYKFKGFPDRFSKAINFSVKHRGSLNGDSYISHGHDVFLDYLDTTVFSYDLIPCQDSSGYLTGNLMLTGEELNAGGKTVRVSDGPDIIEVWNYFIGQTSNRVKKSVHFDSIVYPTTIDPDVVDRLAATLDAFYEMYYNLGINENKFPNFDLNKKVTILDLRPNTSEPHFFYFNKAENQFKLKIYSAIINEVFRKDICNTFFAYFLYDYVYKSKFKVLPIDASVMFWLEEKWNTTGTSPSFVPSYFLADKYKIYLDIFDEDAINCEVIEYHTERYGEQIIGDYYEHFLKGNEWYEALFYVLEDPLEELLPDFFKKFFMREVYRIPESIFADKIFNNSDNTIHIDLPEKNTTKAHFKFFKDVSAKVYYLNLDNQDLNEFSRLSFEVTSDDLESKNLQILLFRVYRNNKVFNFIDEGLKLEIDNPLYYKDNNSDLFLVIVNSNAISMGQYRKDDLFSIRLDVTLKEVNQLKCNMMQIVLDSVWVERVSYNIDTQIYYPGKYGFNFPFEETYRGSFKDNTDFSADWNYVDNGKTNIGEVTATVDPETLIVKKFDFKLEEKYYNTLENQDVETSQRITGIDVQLEATSFGYRGIIKGEELIDHVNIMEYIIKTSNQFGSYTEEVIDFTENSKLTISFIDP